MNQHRTGSARTSGTRRKRARKAGRPRLLTLVAAALLLAATGAVAAADPPVYRGEPSGAFMREWLVCGPLPLAPDDSADNTRHLEGFERDFLREQGGEASPQARAGDVVVYPGGQARWRRYASPHDIVDLDEAISDDEHVAGYATCEIESAAEQAWLLALGSNDGVRVWLNGERVWDVTRGRAVHPDEDVTPVMLRKGRNRLVLKIEERGNRWGFACRLAALDAPEFSDSRLNLFRVVSAPAGSPSLESVPSPARIERLIEQAEIEAAPRGAPKEVVWRADWSGQPSLPIGIETTQYGEYTLRVAVRFTGGAERQLELPFWAGRREEHVLFQDGKTDYRIVVGREASESERWAADELSHWLGAVSGAEFPVVHDAGPPREREIVVGWNAHARAALGDAAHPFDDRDESFAYRNAGPTLVIWGGQQRGTMYGVMAFLERELGCRSYTPQVSVTPKRERYAFDYLRHAESPAVAARNVFYYEAFDPIWAARNRVNGAMGYREQPGGVEAYWSVHTLVNRFVRPQDYFDDHPEYFALVDGERYKGRDTQLCLTNPEVLEIVVRQLRECMREHPEYRVYSVSQNDGGRYCECDRCTALAEREGSQSGVVLWFVNQVAQAVEDEFPDKLIGTLAYVYSRKPPRSIRPRRNVAIRLCSFECCRAHPIATGPRNAEFLEDLRAWSAIAPHLYVWDYVVDFGHYIMPFPNFGVLHANMQLFADAGVTGVMTQAAYQSRGGEFAELRAYLLARLLWDPECDAEAVIADFMSGYYGRASVYIRRYFDRLQARVGPETHLNLFSPFDPLFDDEFVAEAERLFDAAEAVADAAAVRRRVEMARLPIMYLKCERRPVEAKRDGTYTRFRAILEREGITHLSEHGAGDRQAFFARMDAAQ